MKITKFKHACFSVELDGETLIVDPGGWSSDLVIPDNVTAVIITHEHADHLDKDALQKIFDKNSQAVILAHQDVTSQLGEFKTKSVVPNEGMKIGRFELEFFGGEHAMIAKAMPVVANLGVLINERLYYPGDSFTLPDQPVQVLALPVAAPWLKVDETIGFLTGVKPKLVFPTHDAILSEEGKGLVDRVLTPIAEKVGAKYQRLQEPLEI